jgi:HPt (histidine-containing phosphotransfer) domain-containing protein
MDIDPSDLSIDPKAIARILLIADRDFVVEMIDTFLVDAQRFMSQMQTAFDSGDPEVLHHATHSLKSISASMGAVKLSSICKQLELQARHQKQTIDRDQLDFIQAEYQKVQESLDFYRQEYS